MTRDIIIAEIKRTTQANNGKPLGSRKFESETGIKSAIWLGKIWARWGDALQEAGFLPNELVEAYDKDSLLESYASLSNEQGKLITSSDMRLISRNGTEIPNWKTYQKHFGSKAKFIKILSVYLLRESKFPYVLKMCLDYSKEIGVEINNKSNIVSISEVKSLQFVYLLKSGKFYKIGRTNSVGRRQYEIATLMPEEVIEVHKISTDDSVGIENYWHQRFASKRKKGEWFDLSREDIAAFKLRKFM